MAQIREAPARWVAAPSRRSRCVGGIRVRIKHSGDQGHAHEIGEARSLHLHHEIGPVVLNRSRTDPKVAGNLFVRMSSHQCLEDIALAVRQRRESALDLVALRLALLISIPPNQAPIDGGGRKCIAKRLLPDKKPMLEGV